MRRNGGIDLDGADAGYGDAVERRARVPSISTVPELASVPPVIEDAALKRQRAGAVDRDGVAGIGDPGEQIERERAERQNLDGAGVGDRSRCPAHCPCR